MHITTGNCGSTLLVCHLCRQILYTVYNIALVFWTLIPFGSPTPNSLASPSLSCSLWISRWMNLMQFPCTDSRNDSCNRQINHILLRFQINEEKSFLDWYGHKNKVKSSEYHCLPLIMVMALTQNQTTVYIFVLICVLWKSWIFGRKFVLSIDQTSATERLPN